MASAGQHPEKQKENQGGHSSERTVEGRYYTKPHTPPPETRLCPLPFALGGSAFRSFTHMPIHRTRARRAHVPHLPHVRTRDARSAPHHAHHAPRPARLANNDGPTDDGKQVFLF